MPNHCYTFITVEEKFNKKLQEIAKVGLCRYYVPMPAELESTTSPARIVSEEEYIKKMKENETAKYKSYPITEERSKYLTDKYGFNDWYNWAYHNWGTKWGCYDNEYDDGTYRFTSAWGPVDDSILQRLTKDIPTFDYSYEEETGWGGEFVMRDGEIISSLHWEEPEFEHVDGDIYYLAKKHINGEGVFKIGYYAFGSLDEYIGETLEEAAKGI